MFDRLVRPWTIGDTLEKVVALEPTHLSCYSLILEEGTPFHALYVKGELNLPGDDVEREMLEFAVEYLTQHGYIHYEVSNFCLPGLVASTTCIIGTTTLFRLRTCCSRPPRDVRYSNRSDLNSYISSWQRVSLISRSLKPSIETWLWTRRLSAGCGSSTESVTQTSRAFGHAG